MSVNNPILFYTVLSVLALLFAAMVVVLVLLIRRIKRMKMHLYNDELELSAKIEF